MPERSNLGSGGAPQRAWRTGITTILLMLVAAVSAAAQTPQLLSVQGALATTTGQPMTGMTTLTFSLYSSATGGSALASETEDVILTGQGVFIVTLGDDDALYADDFNQPLFLGITPDGESELTPRLPLRTAPYAMRAVIADSLSPTADINFNSKRLTGLTSPTADNEAATKKYVDDILALATGPQGPPGEIAGLPSGTLLSSPNLYETTLTSRDYVRTTAISEVSPAPQSITATLSESLDLSCESIVPSSMIISRASGGNLLVGNLTYCDLTGYEAGGFLVSISTQAITTLPTTVLGDYLEGEPIVYALNQGLLYTDAVGSAAVLLSTTSSSWTVVATPPLVTPPFTPLQESGSGTGSVVFREGEQGDYAFFRDGAGDVFFWNMANNSWTLTSTSLRPDLHIGLIQTWANDRLVLWGGTNPSTGAFESNGATYIPTSSSWAAISITTSPDLDPDLIPYGVPSGSGYHGGYIGVLQADASSVYPILKRLNVVGNAWTDVNLDKAYLPHLCRPGTSGVWSGEEHFFSLKNFDSTLLAVDPDPGTYPGNTRTFGVSGNPVTVIPFHSLTAFLRISSSTEANAIQVEKIPYGDANETLLYQYRAP